MSLSSVRRALTKTSSLLGWWGAGYKGRLRQHAKRVAVATVTGKLVSALLRGSK